MRFEFLRAGQVHSVELLDAGDGRRRARWQVREDGDDGEVLEERELDLHVESAGDGVYSVLAGHEIHDVRVDRDGASRTVSLASGTVSLEHLDPFRGGAAGGGARGGGPQSVSSPMPGRVVKLEVSVGDAVDEGQAVVIVEAMKMANELRSPCAGRVQAVQCADGDTVDGGQPLVVIEPASD